MDRIDAGIVALPGDVPFVTCGGVVEVCSETGGFDVWIAGDLVAPDVSEEVAVTYLRNGGGK
jgi:hypothetical protein